MMPPGSPEWWQSSGGVAMKWWRSDNILTDVRGGVSCSE